MEWYEVEYSQLAPGDENVLEVGKGGKYLEWQERVNEFYFKNNRLSHTAICTRLASELGTNPETLRRNTKSPAKLKKK